MSDFQQTTSQVAQRLARLTELLQSIALKRLDDQEAQRRAQAANAFYNSMPGFPKRTGSELPTTPSSLSSSDPVLEMHAKPDLSRLPTEILLLIVDKVDSFDLESRQKTMVALSASNSTLRAIAEPRLYTRPRDLDTVEKQWEFLLALKIEPHLGSLVKSLSVLWLPTGENGKLLTDIIRACPNNEELVIQRGSSYEDSNKILKEDLLDLAAIFDASPKVTEFMYATFLGYSPEEERYGNMSFAQTVDLATSDDRFVKFASQLTRLRLRCQVQWILQALSPHLSSNFTSLYLGQETLYLSYNPRFFTDLARQCPQLQELDVRCPLDSPTDLADACVMWGETLQELNISNIGDSTEWIPRVMPFLRVLNTLDFGFETSIRDLAAISRALPEQRFISIELPNLSDPEEVLNVATAKAELDDSLIRLIRSHSSTLQRLDINSGRFTRVGRAVLQACKQASRLETLCLAPPVDVESSDIDNLLQTCVDLTTLSQALKDCSARKHDWDERARALDEECWEGLMRNPLGLGT